MNVGGFMAKHPPAPPSSGRRRRPQRAGRVPARPATCRAYEYEALWLWNMPRPKYGIWRRGPSGTRANGRSLIYEPGAAPPPCHNRIPGARARSPPAARRRLALSPASDGERCARPHSVSAPHSVLRPSPSRVNGAASVPLSARVESPRLPGRSPRRAACHALALAASAPARQHAAHQACLRPTRLHRYLTPHYQHPPPHITYKRHYLRNSENIYKSYRDFSDSVRNWFESHENDSVSDDKIRHSTESEHKKPPPTWWVNSAVNFHLRWKL